jgi:pimeloyl-ACP methyl ester carboxylesterase
MTSERQNIRYRDITVNGVHSPVREAGPEGTSEAIVFLHGHPGSSEDWTGLLPIAGKYGRAVAVDLPGFGMADKPRDFNYTVPGYARHLAGMFDELAIDRAHLVLHDFGCFVGLAWAVTHPQQLGALVFLNVGIIPGYRWHLAASIWRTPILGELAMYTINRPTFRLGMRLVNPQPLPREFVDRMYQKYDRNTRRAALQLYRSADNPGKASQLIGNALGGRQRPVLVIWGSRDPFLPVTYAHRQREFFPEAEITILPESGHWPYVDDPHRVRERLDQFFRKHWTAWPRSVHPATPATPTAGSGRSRGR